VGQTSYAGLGARLRAEAGDRLALNFAEVERLLGRSLPWSARGPGWWANYRGRAHARAWLEAGWRVHLVEPGARRVTFVRTGAPTDGEAAPSAYARLGAHLRTRETGRVDLSFDHVEAILGRRLPPSARTMRGWWGNVRRGHVQAAA
jgi:hypothetical protein